MITCPNCGSLTKDDIQVYNENLRKQNFRMLPVLPTCKRCSAVERRKLRRRNFISVQTHLKRVRRFTEPWDALMRKK